MVFMFLFVFQMNSFLQPLRGLLKSGSTKVSPNLIDDDIANLTNYRSNQFYCLWSQQLATFMFWMEVFMNEWNYRKLAIHNAIRTQTIATAHTGVTSNEGSDGE
jgi:hypothetical protein